MMSSILSIISKSFVALLALALVAVPAMAGQSGNLNRLNTNKCDTDKSLLVNISAERPRGVQVALLVAFANAAGETMGGQPFGGQGALVQLFFSDAAAPYVLDLTELTVDEVEALEEYLQAEFGYGIADLLTLQGGDPDPNGQLPDILTLQGMGANVYACNLCVVETLAAVVEILEGNGVTTSIDPEDFEAYLLDGVEVMSPDKFSVMYDRTEKKPRCDISAAVISF